MDDRHVADVELSAFLDDELSESRALALTRHVVGCDACHRSLEELRGAREALRGLPMVQAPVLHAAARPERRRRPRLQRAVMATAAGTLATVALLGGAYLAGGSGGEVEPPMDVYVADHLARTGGGPVPPTVGDGQR